MRHCQSSELKLYFCGNGKAITVEGIASATRRGLRRTRRLGAARPLRRPGERIPSGPLRRRSVRFFPPCHAAVYRPGPAAFSPGHVVQRPAPVGNVPRAALGDSHAARQSRRRRARALLVEFVLSLFLVAALSVNYISSQLISVSRRMITT